MAGRSFLSDTFFFQGRLLYIPLEDGETIERWEERLAFIVNTLSHETPVRSVIEQSRKHVNRVVLGVSYQ